MSETRSTELSVVVPSVNGWEDLNGCLAALEVERQTGAIEVLVPERCGAEVRNAVASRYPWVRVLSVDAATTIPEMRALAFAEALSPTVAVIEDHVLVPAGWASRIIAAVSVDRRVVGGGLVNAATDRIIDWAAFFCEYSEVIAPGTAGPVTRLTGNNTAYDRELLVEFRDVVNTGGWEDVLHRAFVNNGIVLWYRPDILVRHKKHYAIGEYVSQRFLYARAFAGMRLEHAGLLHRVTFGILALGLPPLLLWRIVMRVWRLKPHRPALVKSLPLLALFVGAWGLGEVVGAWFGQGNALVKVR